MGVTCSAQKVDRKEEIGKWERGGEREVKERP